MHRPNPTHLTRSPSFYLLPLLSLLEPTPSAMQLRGQKLIRDSNPDVRINVDLSVCQIGVNML